MRRPVYDLTRPGWVLLVAVMVLGAVGLACIYATESPNPGLPINTLRQGAYACVSVVIAVLVLNVGYGRVARHAYLIFAIVVAMLVLLLVAKFGHTELGGLVPARRNAHRWIRLPGFQLQPSELMKIAYVLALAWYLRYRRNCRSLGGVLLPLVVSGVPLALILFEPDLGTVILMVPVPILLLFVAGARTRHLGVVLLAGVLAAPLLWTRIEPYQRMRFVGLLLQSDSLRARIVSDPEKHRWLCTKRQAMEYEADSGLQLLRSKAALGSGGPWGQGWGHGTYVRYDFLPDRHNDFVFALVGHQWGLAGCLVVLAGYVAIAVAGIQIASATTEPLGRLLAVGGVALISVQAIVNVGMTAGLMPITGMTLPFVSYGGSSLLINFIAASLLISVSQHRPFLLSKKPFEYRATAERGELAELAAPARTNAGHTPSSPSGGTA